jgi:glycosyltransferase involved in cell wall biosynthesis
MSDSEPLVSIIMNCYNGEKYLREAIDSVYAQTYTSWEIIFWDNCSTDNSAEIAQSYDEKLKYYRAKMNTPLGKARNMAIGKVTGKYIAFLDVDDLYLTTKLERQVSGMEESDYALGCSSSIIIDGNNVETNRRLVKHKSGNIFGLLLKHYFISMQSVIIRRSILEDLNLNFDEKLKYCPDYDLFMQIASCNFFLVQDDYLVKYRILPNSLSAQSLNILSSESTYVLDKLFYDNNELSDMYNKEKTEAYAKSIYYNMVFYLSADDRKQARSVVKTIAKVRVVYFLIYCSLFLPLTNKFILRLLGR